MQRSLFIICLLAITAHLSAQTATGSWYGRADVDMAGMHNNYLTELVIKQKGNRVDGIFGYYFRDKYQSFFVHGTYNPRTREITILNIPVIYFNSNSTVNSIDCNTNFRGVFINSKVGSTLKGYFYHDDRYKYMCPDLKVSYTLDREDRKQDSLQDMASAKATEQIWKPQADDVVVDVVATDRSDMAVAAPAPAGIAASPAMVLKNSAAATVKDPSASAFQDSSAEAFKGSSAATIKPVVSAPLAAKGDSAVKAVDSTQSVVSTTPAPATAVPATPSMIMAATSTATSPLAATTTGQPVSAAQSASTAAAPMTAPSQVLNEDTRKIVESFTKRKAVLNQVLEVESDSVRVSFYDNGEIDGDSITVFINKHPVLTHQELQAKALTLYLLLDSTKEFNELSMFAENLGKYPPNTALMVVTDGKNRYEVFMSSSLSENATVQLTRKKKDAPKTGPGRRLSF